MDQETNLTALVGRYIWHHKNRGKISSICSEQFKGFVLRTEEFNWQNSSVLANNEGICEAQLAAHTRAEEEVLFLRQSKLKVIVDDESIDRKEGRSVTYIAFELGYLNVSHFSRCFKQFAGVSPSQCKTDAQRVLNWASFLIGYNTPVSANLVDFSLLTSLHNLAPCIVTSGAPDIL